MTPCPIALAGAMARQGTMQNAIRTLENHYFAEEPMPQPHAIETNQRRRAYCERLTELHDLAGDELEWWER